MQNKHLWKKTARTVLLSALVCVMLGTTVCLGGCKRKLDSSGMSIIDRKSGASYRYMPAYIGPAERSKKAYASATISGAKQDLYTIRGLDASEWLCTEWGDVLYSGSDRILTITDFEPSKAYICNAEGTVNIALVEISGADLDAIVKCWADGEAAEYPLSDPSNAYLVRFESEKYPGLYYTVSALEYGSTVYLYSKYEDARCVDGTAALEKFLADE